MANEYVVNQADLTSVANAIRTKGETSAQLVFPSGFVTAIENIKGGADLNFEVVGGTTKPSNPKPNTIWVNTSTAIAGWAFSTDEPTTPVSGMVWIKTEQSSNTELNALKDNAISLRLLSARQYANGWGEKPTLIYQSGYWNEPGLYIVKNGILQDIPMTVDRSGNAITQMNGYVSFHAKTNDVGVYTITDLVDLTEYDVLEIEITGGESFFRQGSTPIICIGANRPTSPNNSSSSTTNISAYVHTTHNTSQESVVMHSGVYSLSVSRFKGNYYIGLVVNGTKSLAPYVNVTNFVLK